MDCTAVDICQPSSSIGTAASFSHKEAEPISIAIHPDVEALGPGFPLAILQPKNGLSAGKTYQYESGIWGVQSGYGKAKWFKCYLRCVVDLMAWHELLLKISQKNVFLVMALPLEDANLHKMLRRSHSQTTLYRGQHEIEPATLADRPCYILPFDFDSTECPSDIDPIKSPNEAIVWLIEQKLPVVFHGAGVVYQFSSSFGLSNTKLKVHLFFWLQDPFTMAKAKGWAKSYNLRHGYNGSDNATKIIDDSVYQPQQPIYTKQRECIGAPDPIPVMIDYIPGHEVDFLSVLEEQARWECEEAARKLKNNGQPLAQGDDSQSSGKSIDSHLANIGVSGHHEPIRNAAAAMVAQYGKEQIKTDIDSYIRMLKDAVNVADRRGKSETEFSTYLSDAYLRQQFTSAIGKGFGDGEHHLSRTTSDVAPEADFISDDAVITHEFPAPLAYVEIDEIVCANVAEGRAALASEIATPGDREIICPTGLGKSHAALEHVRAESISRPVIVTAPTLALAQELFDRYDGGSAIMASGRNDRNCSRYKEVKTVTARGFDPGSTVCLNCREDTLEMTALNGGNLEFSFRPPCGYDQLLANIKDLECGVVFGSTAQLRLLRKLMAGSDTDSETQKRKNYSVLCVIDEPALNQLQEEVSFNLKEGVADLEEALSQLTDCPEYGTLIEALEELLEICDRVGKGRTLRNANEYAGGYLFVIPGHPPLEKGAGLADRLDLNSLQKVINSALEVLKFQDAVDSQFMLHIKGFDRRMILFLQLLGGLAHFDTCFLKIDPRQTTVVMQSTAWCKELPVRTTEFLLLDATASPGVAQAIFGRPVREVKISCHVEWRHQEHIAASISKTYLQKLPSKQLTVNIQSWFGPAAETLKRSEKILCCCFKMLEDAIRDYLECNFPTVIVEVAHYGAIRGIDKWKDFDTVILAGNPLWPAEALFIDGWAIFGDDHVSRESWAAVQARDELTQAAGRVRAINAPGEKTLIYVGREWPWQETQPDHLVIIPHGNVSDGMAEALNRSFEWIVRTKKSGCQVLNREVGLLLNILTPGLLEQDIERYGGKLQEIAISALTYPFPRDLSASVSLSRKQWSRLIESVARRCAVKTCEHKSVSIGQFTAAVGKREDAIRFLEAVDGEFKQDEWVF